MTLPKIEHPVYKIEVPSTKEQRPFRPFTVKEEKLLLTAKESEDKSDILTSIKNVVSNCSIDEKLNISDLTIFDLEYIFLKLRMYSVDSISPLTFIDKEDESPYEFEVDLTKVEMKYPEDISNIIKITDDMGIIMKYPSASLYDDEDYLKLKKDQFYEMIVRCVDKIYKGDEVYNAKEYKKEQVSDFLETLDSKSYNEIKKFLTNLPRLYHEIKYTNKKGNERNIILSSLSDFFTF